MSLSDAVRQEREKRKQHAFLRREQDILDQAEAAMIEEGVRQVSVDIIAARAGIGKGTIYKHFDSKQQVWIALVVRGFDHLAEVLGRVNDPVQCVHDWMESQLYGASRSRVLRELAVLLAEDGVSEPVQAAHQRMHRRLVQLLVTTSGAAEATARAHWLEALVDGALVRLHEAGGSIGLDQDAYIEAMLSSVRVLVQIGPRAGKKDSGLTYL